MSGWLNIPVARRVSCGVVVTRLVVTGWLACAAVAACGRFGFEPQHTIGAVDAPPSVSDGATPIVDGADTTGDASAHPDAAPGSDAGAGACGYIPCTSGKVTCCDNGVAVCIPDTSACARRFECDQPSSVGCGGSTPECCITQDSMGTECIDPATDPCFG
jgi:hypothetical protein